MPLDTDFNVFPYFDDYSANAEFYGVLFKPKTSVQARELNTLQSILRNQIEKFGDQIFVTGTILDGCNFTFYPAYQYVKIKDLTTDGQNVIPASYPGLFVRNTANLSAFVIDYATGFESTDPNLNTLYLNYRNAGNTGLLTAFNSGDVLTIYDSNNGIWSATIQNAGLNFANTDTAVFTPQVAVTVTSGSFSNGDYVTQPTTGANLQIIGIDTSSFSNAGFTVLTLKPRNADLSNSSSNGAQWAVANNDSIKNAANTAVGTVQLVFGVSATGGVVTDGSGRIVQVPITNRGIGYSYLPTTTVFSPNNSSGVASVQLTALNYVTKVTVANTTNSVGNGYAFGVSSGTIYQKGLFLKVDAQTIIVNNYSQVPNNVSVGFFSQEQTITSNIDQSLLDNAAGFPNYQAPGADRVKVVPTLILQSGTTTTGDFMPIVSWSEGNAYRQNQTTSYSEIGNKMAQELYETEGDFVLSRFSVTSRSPYTSSYESTRLSIITNPGSAYIKGQRVFNNTNYTTDIAKTTDTAITNSVSISLNYGNWIRVQEVGGVFQFNTGDTVTFYDTAKQFISGNYVNQANTAPNGNILGTARVRNMIHEFGIPGTYNATYKMYLFDITMNQGANFSDIRAIGYAGTYNGIADITLTPNTALNANVAQITNTQFDFLLFPSGANSLKNANNISYTYRTIDQTTTMANTGILTKSLATTNETYPYTGTLTASQLQDLYITPLSANLIATANTAGSANIVNSSINITGNSSTWLNDFAQGDYIYLFQNSTVHDVRRVITIANNTYMSLDANPAFTGNNIGTYRYFPAYAPIPLGLRSGISANVSANGTVLTVSLGTALQGGATVATAVNIQRTGVSPTTKTAARDQFIKISAANNTGGYTGPWCVGTSDIFRLKRVFMDSANTVSNTSTDVTSYFYIDHKQNEDYLDIGYLYLLPSSGLTIPTGSYLLVQYDAFQTTGSGFTIAPSYVTSNAATIASNDAKQLINMGSAVSSWEIPEVFGSLGQYWDLQNQFDFRPIAANCATASSNSQLAPVNPTYTLSFGNTANSGADFKFPVPDSILSYNMETYLPRIDACFAASTGQIGITRGIPNFIAKQPRIPKDSIRLSNIYLPSYPCLPAVASQMQAEMLTTRIGNINLLAKRQSIKVISIPASTTGTAYDTQPRRYTMANIGSLDRRISALEYYNSLSDLQTDMVNRVVPSSSDGTVNRFKFGVFVDDFSSSISQDYTNPSYSARVSASNLTPPVVEWVATYGATKSASVPYIDFPIVAQNDASIPIPPPVVITPVTPVVVVNTSINTQVWALRQDHLQASSSGQVALSDEFTFYGSSVAAPATLFFYVPPTQVLNSSSFLDPDQFIIYQSDGTTSHQIADAYDNATALSATDIVNLQSGAYSFENGHFFSALPLSSSPLGRPASGFVNGCGRVDWNYNPANGRYITIASTRQGLYDHWWWGVRYPSNFGANITVPPQPTATTSYAGSMDIEPPSLALALTATTGAQTSSVDSSDAVYLDALEQNSINNSGETGSIFGTTGQNPGSSYTEIGTTLSLYSALANDPSATTYQNGGGIPVPSINPVWVPQSFSVTVYGLCPSAAFEWYVNGVNKRSATLQYGRGYGDNLLSDTNGICRFTWYFNGNTTDQDIVNTFIGPLSSAINWATVAAGSVAQPLSSGSLSCSISGPQSSASFTLAVVADAETKLNTVSGQVASLLNTYNSWNADSGGGSYGGG